MFKFLLSQAFREISLSPRFNIGVKNKMATSMQKCLSMSMVVLKT